MKKEYIQGVLIALTICLLAAQARASVINSSADPALNGATIEDFSSYPTGSSTAFPDFGEFTVYPLGTNSWTIANGADIIGTSGKVLVLDEYGYQTTFQFDNLVSAAAFQLGAPNYDHTISAFDSDGQLIESHTIVGITSGGNSFDEQFVGIAANGIKSIQLQSLGFGTLDRILVDDFSFVDMPVSPVSTVPLPAGGLLLLSGLGALFVARRQTRPHRRHPQPTTPAQ